MKVLILGSGKSGLSADEFLKESGYETEFAKSDDINSNFLKKDYLDRLFNGLSFIVKSPGISNFNNLICEAKARGIKVVNEFEIGANSLKGETIAITGTNGKTTTVSLIYSLLGEENVFLGGNIGVPVTKFAKKTNNSSLSILEVSSFQLDGIKNFKPKISAILNIASDHLNYHKTIKNYINAKFTICKFQTENDFLILNADDEYLKNHIPKTKAQIFYFSLKNKVKGCYLSRGCIYFNDNKKTQKLGSIKNINLVGDHNKSNVLCAVLAAQLSGRKFDISKLNNFNLDKHRIEYVDKISGVEFYDDSKATNISSTLASTKCFKRKINLILGGSDKGYAFDELFSNLPKNVVRIAAYGQTRFSILKSAKKYNFNEIFGCKTLGEATKRLFDLSKSNEIILLSPGCASFDQFNGYAERGAFFVNFVEELKNESISGRCQKKT
ncbi:MAG: UDP-N-acetylmuramoyl-L-alanine--D-glutamate ligase [Clostridia bacterium]|nr:UDP-N-acetylmuramoyl-L-alanine--D-glutamate ligase [Clostridia bacterium]